MSVRITFTTTQTNKEKMIMATAVQVSNEYRNVPVTALVGVHQQSPQTL